MYYKPCTCQVDISILLLPYMRLQILVVLYCAKVLGFLSRLFGTGRGTSIPGWVVEKYTPSVMKYFAGSYKHIIFISGTNGKTTTRSLVVHALRAKGFTVVTNSGGANIYRGIAASLLQDLTWLGTIKSLVAVLEVEEATLPKLSQYLPADVLLLTNLARDQLDVYGELAITQEYFMQTIRQMPRAGVILNIDDPKLLELPVFADIGVSLKSSNIEYETSQTVHAKIQGLLVAQENKTQLILTYQDTAITFVPQLTGQYNSINYALAASVLICAGLTLQDIKPAFETSVPVFGRSENIRSSSASHTLLLVKNPLGFGSVLTSYKNKHIHNLMVGINDNIADGRDVSWLWDVDFEHFLQSQTQLNEVIVTGTRQEDIYVRLSQAIRSVNLKISIIAMSLDEVAELLLETKQDYTIFGTYTVTLGIRNRLEQPLGLLPIDSDQF